MKEEIESNITYKKSLLAYIHDLKKKEIILSNMLHKTLWATAIIGALNAFAYEAEKIFSPYRKYPLIDTVEQGYIAPSRLEITVDDLDGNGEKETILRVDDQPYLLREIITSTGSKPILSSYTVEPVEVL